VSEVNTVADLVINSWNDLQDYMFRDAWRAELKRFRSPYVFRGMNLASDNLKTSLMRLGGQYANMEHHLIRNFRKYAHNNLVEKDTIWHWLSMAQHYGLPTRLLDWTVSPYVAAHFATDDLAQFDQDGVIWAVNYLKAHELLPELLKNELQKEGAEYFTVEMLSNGMDTLQDLEELSGSDFVLFFEPPSIDERIVNQFALFSVMSGPKAVLDLWLLNFPEMWYRIIIPAGLKWEVRDKLDQLNITERVLFPGLDGLSRWQRRYYTPRVE